MTIVHDQLTRYFHLKASPPIVVAVPVTVSPSPTGTVPVVTTHGSNPPGNNASMAKLGKDLISVYQAFLNNPGGTSSLKTSFPGLSFNGSKVSINVQTKANVNVFATELANLGMDVTTKNATYGWVSGDFPINQLPTLAALPDTLSGSPNYAPTTHHGLLH